MYNMLSQTGHLDDGTPVTTSYTYNSFSEVLTVTDPKGATSQAAGSVTVVDDTGPHVSAIVASLVSLWPPNHRMVDISLDYGASDNCGSATCASPTSR